MTEGPGAPGDAAVARGRGYFRSEAERSSSTTLAARDQSARPWRPAQRAPYRVRGTDLYETPACAVRALVQTGEVDRLAPYGGVWEPAAGRGAIVRELSSAGFVVAASDNVSYDGADAGIETPVDFLTQRAPPPPVTAIVTNPPYKIADAFIRHGLSLSSNGPLADVSRIVDDLIVDLSPIDATMAAFEQGGPQCANAIEKIFERLLEIEHGIQLLEDEKADDSWLEEEAAREEKAPAREIRIR